MIKQIKISIIISLLSGCATDIDYVRPNPSLHGTISSNTENISGLTVAYSYSHDKYCKTPLKKTITNEHGEFRLKLKRRLNLIEILPIDGCSFDGRICIPDKESWMFTIDGIGHKTYHTGENILRKPSSLMDMTTEGDCEPPDWLELKCNLTHQKLECNIINNDKQSDENLTIKSSSPTKVVGLDRQTAAATY